MPSGAGHDAQVLATIMPAGMLFVPSIGGISHHWTENTADADIVTGAEVFVETCRLLLRRAERPERRFLKVFLVSTPMPLYGYLPA